MDESDSTKPDLWTRLWRSCFKKRDLKHPDDIEKEIKVSRRPGGTRLITRQEGRDD
jgi:hypothetical protein